MMIDTAQLHADQVEYWNGAGGARWVANLARSEAMLGEVAERVISRAAPADGEKIIDVGCGSGGTTMELARRVGPSGHVMAVDVSAPILAVARERLAECPTVKIVLADAASYPFPEAAADLLFSRFGVMFFGDPPAAFANMRKALKPTGRVVFACWRNPKENGWMTAPLEATYKHVDRPPPPSPDDPGPFAFANPDRVSRVLIEAGFEAPSFEPVDLMVDIAGGAGVEGAVGCAMNLGPSSRLLEGQSDHVKAAVAGSMTELLETYEADGKVQLPAAIWIVTTSPAGA
jgi:SAM-dependent methyltransferase